MITVKGRRQTFRRQVVDRLAAELAAFGGPLCLVHGGGSFGHPLAQDHDLHRGMTRAEQRLGFAAVQRSMRVLNGRVLTSLHAHGLPAVAVAPGPMVTVEAGEIVTFDGEAVEASLAAGLLPVTFGDAVLDYIRGSAIVSGDDLMLHLARLLRPKAALFVADVDGVRGADGSVLPRIEGQPPPGLQSAKGIDVTGGLARKVERMIAIAEGGPRTLLLNGLVPGRLRTALEGGAVPGTEVRA